MDSSVSNVAKNASRCDPGSSRPLAQRLGLTVHQSVLDRRLRAIERAFPSPTAKTMEEWLLDIANARDVRVVQRDNAPGDSFAPPDRETLSDEDLVVSICMLQRLDHPQMLRAAGQFISRGRLDVCRLIHAARRERAGVVLGEMARQALRVAPEHAVWQALAAAFPPSHALRSPVIHWQRLAWPTMHARGPNAARWELVR